MKKEKNEFLEWLKIIAITAVFFIALRTFIFTPIVVEGVSMMPTYEDGDKVIVNKIGKKISEFDRFDVIVFKAPEGKNYIKRIIGIPGDHIEYKDDVLYINGETYDEPYLDAYKSQLKDFGNLTYDFTLEEVAGIHEVPEGYFFVLGDNRRRSLDSREQSVGLVSMDKILGEVNVRYYPFDKVGIVE